MLTEVRQRRRIYLAAGVLVGLAAALAVAVLYYEAMTPNRSWPLTGASDEVRQAPLAYDGPSLLEARIVRSDVIARVRLVSVAQVVEKETGWLSLEDTSYLSALEFKFTALEYLKGSGGSEIVAIAYDADNRYETRQRATDDAPDYLGERGRELGLP